MHGKLRNTLHEINCPVHALWYGVRTKESVYGVVAIIMREDIEASLEELLEFCYCSVHLDSIMLHFESVMIMNRELSLEPLQDRLEISRLGPHEIGNGLRTHEFLPLLRLGICNSPELFLQGLQILLLHSDQNMHGLLRRSPHSKSMP